MHKHGIVQDGNYDRQTCIVCGTAVVRPYDTSAAAALPFIDGVVDMIICTPSCLYTAAKMAAPPSRPDIAEAVLDRLLQDPDVHEVHEVECGSGRSLDHCSVCLQQISALYDMSWSDLDVVRRLVVCSGMCAVTALSLLLIPEEVARVYGQIVAREARGSVLPSGV